MKYESNILERLIKTYGVVGNPKYVSEIIKQFIIQGKECYPNLFTYQSDWLAHIDEFGLANDYVVTYTGQRFYAPNTKESPVKRAILKGQTLVNVDSCYAINDFKWSNISNIDNDGFITINANGGYVNAFTGLKPLIKPNTKYLAIVDIKENTIDGKLCLFSQHNGESIFSKQGVQVSAGTTGMLKYILTSDSEFTSDTNIALRNYLDGSSTQGSVIYRTMLIEYIDGMENWDIPFFRGMQSVKLPVLTTTGKNLFDGILDKGYLGDSTGNVNPNGTGVHSPNYIRVKPSTNYSCSWGTKPSSSVFKAYFYDENKVFLNQSKQSNSFTTPNGCYYVRFRFYGGTTTPSEFENIQIEEGSTATSYEPYNSNILTVNEDVELGSVGEVKDELNLLTGQLTQRTETRAYQEGDESNSEVITDMANTRYKLPKESIKTVDLNIKDHNQQKVERLTSFEGGTHFDTSSQTGSVLPTLEVDVVVDLEETLMTCSTEGNTM